MIRERELPASSNNKKDNDSNSVSSIEMEKLIVPPGNDDSKSEIIVFDVCTLEV